VAQDQAFVCKSYMPAVVKIVEVQVVNDDVIMICHFICYYSARHHFTDTLDLA
jgi:hypothetical protein